ncbi:MAG: DUF2341 domain-containing protein, partial [Candidatus Doudnabacteria bacterium]|nr:DUF2341 domain-containing protein [Candidatus Doudnabacteria bacterium]
MITAAICFIVVFNIYDAQAVTRTWDGGGSTNNWSECANWSSDTCPTSIDVAQFDATSTKNATIDGSFTGSLTGLTINSGYSGTITQARSLTIGATGYSQAAGTFTGATQAIDIDGPFSLTAGVFTPTTGTFTTSANFTFSGGTYTGAGTTVVFDGAGSGSATTFTCTGNFVTNTSAAVEISKSTDGAFTLATGCDLTANVISSVTAATLTVNSGASLTSTANWTSGPITNSGTITVAGTSFVASGLNNFSTVDLSSATTFDLNVANVGTGSMINNIGGTITYGGSSLTINGNWTQDGTFVITGDTLTFDGVGSGSTSTLSCSGNFNSITGATVEITKSTDGSFTLSSGCTLTADVNSSTSSGPFTINSTASLTTTGNWSSGPITNSGTINVASTSFTTSGLTNSGTLSMPSATTFDVNVANLGNGSVVNNIGGTVTYSGTSITINGNWTQDGTFDINGKTLTFDGAVSTSSTTFNCTGNFNSLTGATVVITKGTDAAFTLSSGCILTADVNSNTTSGLFTVSSSATLNASSNWSSGPLTISGAVSVAGTSFTVASVTNSGTLTLSSATTFDVNIDNSSSGNITNNLGATITYGGININLEGSWTQSGTFNVTSKVLIFDGSGTNTSTFNCVSGSFAGSVTVNKSNASGSFSLADSCAIDGAFTRTDGIINNPGSSKTLSLLNNFSMSASDAFGGANLELEFTGTAAQTITQNAGTISSPLEINKSSNGVTLATNLSMSTSRSLTVTQGTFSQGATFSMTSGDVIIGASGIWTNVGTGDITLGGDVTNAGSVTIDGTSSGCGAADDITISSSSGGVQRNWSGAGTFSIYDVTVSDMSGSITAFSSTEGSNSDWTFLGGCSAYTQSNYRWFQNADTNNPGTALASENTAVAINNTDPSRLRMNLTASGITVTAGSEDFKLQYSDSLVTNWTDIGSAIGGDWWDPSWSARRKITFDNSASSENLQDFPVYIQLDSSRVDYAQTQNSGQDIRFIDADGSTVLSYEIEFWNEAGTSTVWVKVPQI